MLIIRREHLRNTVPDIVGGGTVAYVNPEEHRYLEDPVHREEGGTPAIIESIRAGLVFQLKEVFMTAVPLLPKNAPFSPEEISVLNKVVSRTTPLQRSWLAGFFAGSEAAQDAQAAPAAAARPRASLTVLYATKISPQC